MKKILTYISICAAISLLPNLLHSQQRSQKRHYTFEKIEMKSPWLLSGNGAGLVFNKADNYANVEGYFTNETGDYRNVDDPSSYTTLGLGTKSYTKVKNVYFYGSFRYDYGINKDLAWRGTVYPRSILNPIADSIPGKVLRESYIMSGKVGYKVSDVVALGAAFDYNTNTSAKRVDARNLNTLSSLKVSPGITLDYSHLKLGANLNYFRDVEDVEYTFIGETTGKSIYYLEGLWFFSKSGISSSTDLKRKYIKDSFGGAIQAHLNLGNFCFFNQFSINYGKKDDYESSNLIKRYAYVESLTYAYDGRFRLKGEDVDHIISLSFVSDENLSYSIINRYERVPEEINTWAFYEYGKDLRYVTGYQKYGAEYKTFIRDGEWRCSWILAAGVNLHKFEKDYKLFPAKYHQNFDINEVYMRANKDFILSNKNSLNLDINGSYVTANGTKLDAQNPLNSGTLMLNNSLLDRDFAYNTSDRYSAGLGFKFMRMVDPNRGSALYLGASYKHIESKDLGSRGLFALSVGFNF